MCNVCFVSPKFPPDVGGISKSAARIVNYLIQDNFRVYVFVYNHVEIIQEHSMIPKSNPNLTVIKVSPPERQGFTIAYYLPLIQSIQEWDNKIGFNVFHGFMLHLSMPCIISARYKLRAVISSVRGVETEWMKDIKYNNIVKYILKNSSWITTVSKEALNTLCSINSQIEKYSTFIPNAITMSSSRSWELNENNKGVIGTVASFRPKKNIPLLIKAYALLDKNVRKKLILVGDFIENEEENVKMKKDILYLIQELGIKNEVEITGYVNNNEIQNYLLNMNVFVLSSDQEGMPNSALEAAITGLPIISTRVDGILDIFENNNNAILVEPNNVIKMANAMERVLKDDKLAKNLSTKAANLSEKLSLNSEKEQWMKIYNELLEV